MHWTSHQSFFSYFAISSTQVFQFILMTYSFRNVYEFIWRKYIFYCNVTKINFFLCVPFKNLYFTWLTIPGFSHLLCYVHSFSSNIDFCTKEKMLTDMELYGQKNLLKRNDFRNLQVKLCRFFWENS